MGSRNQNLVPKKPGESRYATRNVALEKNKRSAKEMAPLKACKQLLKSEDWDDSKFSLLPKSGNKKIAKLENSSSKDLKGKHNFPKNREKVVIVSKKSSSVRVVKNGNQKCVKGVQRSVSVKKVSYSTSVILSSGDESDSEDEDDDEDDDEEEEDEDNNGNKSTIKKKESVIKRTTSRIQTNYCSAKKIDCKPSTKSKALKAPKEKPNGKKKSNTPSRELRPRFPYSATQEWPTARAHRMASLNALAKVHVLYENEGRTTGDTEENSVQETVNDDSSSCDSKIGKDFKEKTKEKGKDEKSNATCKRKKSSDGKKPAKRRRVEVAPDIEIIDTRMCKRMASLNAQAILAASYLCDKPKRRERVKKEDPNIPPDFMNIEIKKEILDYPELQIVDQQKEESLNASESTIESPLSINSCDEVSRKTDEFEKNDLPDQNQKKKKEEQNKICFSEINADKNKQPAKPSETVDKVSCISSTLASTSVSEVGVTKYTKVTKVKINTNKEMEIKEESKAERKIERIVEKDDVAITSMYHYQSNSASQSYSVRMEATFKPNGRNPTPVTGPQRNAAIPTSHVMGAVMPTRQSYYNYNKPGALASQSYPMGRNMQPMIGMDQHMARHYGNSAFSMPQYGHSPAGPYPSNEYGYYQPAGPMIQPVSEQYVVHKPVPYHPHSHPQLHQVQTPVQSTSSSCERYPMGNSPHSSFSRQTNAQIKSSHEPSVAKCTEPSRMVVSSPHNQITSYNASNQRHAGHRNTVTQEPSSQPRSSERRMHPMMSQKRGSVQEKQENPKYSCKRRQNYGGGQEMPSYSSSGYCSYSSPVYVTQHQQPMHIQPSKSHSVFRCHDQADNKHVQYHSPQPSSAAHPPTSSSASQQQPIQAMNDPQKTEPPKVHDDVYSDQVKYNIKCEQYVSNPIVRDTEAQNNKDVIDPNSNLWEPPLVVDIDSDNEPRDTKTYIELDVPKACPQDKIVVVDVRKEAKERYSRRQETMKADQYQSLQNKSVVQRSEATELDTGIKATQSNVQNAKESKVDKQATGSSKNMPDIMFIEMTKKKEPSALIRRARLHGKQRTFRDSENRPLAPYPNTKKSASATASSSSSSSEVSLPKNIFQPQVSLPRLILPKKPETRITHGWSWEGTPTEQLVYVSNDDPPFLRLCYPAIRHQEGDIINVRECVLLKSGARKTDLPFIAKITALWENPADGEMTMSLLWYYRPEHTEPGRKPFHTEGEIFASKHSDTNSVACIEDKCFVLTLNEYCRYRKNCKMLESTWNFPVSVVPPIDDYPRKDRQPPSYISPEMVFICRKVYDFRQKRILKNPV